MLTGSQAAFARLAIPAGALCACACFDPREPAGFIFCPFRLLTGLPCPMCGMTRGLASLLRGRWPDAISYHALSPLVAAALAAWILLEVGHISGIWNVQTVHKKTLQPAPWMAFFGLFLAYGALRWCGIIGGPPA